jgi:hypothetical protein
MTAPVSCALSEGLVPREKWAAVAVPDVAVVRAAAAYSEHLAALVLAGWEPRPDDCDTCRVALVLAARMCHAAADPIVVAELKNGLDNDLEPRRHGADSDELVLLDELIRSTRERIAAALETHQIEWIDHEVGFECGCNEHGQLGALPHLVDTLRHQADAVMGVLSAAPPEREPDWAADGSRDSVWVIGERVVQRGPDQTVLLDGKRVEYPLALAAALRCATHSSDYWDQLAEREAPSPASVRTEAVRRIEQREATPGNPADGPYPASVGEVADELAGLVVELDAGPARGLVRELAARLPEREAPNFEGHPGRECGEHRTVGPHRAFCFDCSEWCYPSSPCARCELPALPPEREAPSRDPGMFEAQLRKLIADTVRDLPALRAQKPYSQMLDHSARATDQIVDGVRRLMGGEQLFPVSSGISVEGGQR